MRKKAFAVLLLGAALAGCGGRQYIPAAGEAAQTQPADIAIETEPLAIVIEPGPPVLEEPEGRTEQDGRIRSYLTGQMTDIKQANRRPLAIMMSNDKASLPQYGINRAAVVYEAPVEGLMNRYMALIEDYDDLERIGSVRSGRTYYIYFAREFDAIYAHYGQSTFARPYLKNIDNINGIEGTGGAAYYRSKDKKSPHNAYTGYDRITKTIEKLGYSREYDPAYEGHFCFARTGEPAELNGADVLAAGLVIPGYQYHEPWFVYHEDDGLYYRFQYGGEHLGDEGQIAVTNIIIQYCAAGYYATTDYRNINVHEGVSGYYITGGKARPVTWDKDGEFGITRYYDSKGEEIVLNQGKTWICIMTGDMIGRAQFQKSE